MSSLTEALSQDEIDNLLASLGSGGGGSSEPAAEKAASSPQATSAPQPVSQQKEEDDYLPSSGLTPDRKNYKLYNFRRPDKFSKDHLRALQSIHDNFARQLGMILTAYLRMNVDIEVVSVDQLTYDEFIRSMPSPFTVTIVEMSPLTGQALFGLSNEMSSSLIDRMLGGPGAASLRPRELTDIEQSLMKRVIDRSIECLEEAWQNFVPVTINVIGLEESYSLIQVATPGEIVALVTFEITLSNRDTGLMSLCIPYPILETVLGQLSAQHIFHRQSDELSEDEKDKILTKIHYAKSPVEVYLGGAKLNVSELLELGVGDVIKLDRGAGEDLLVNVNHKPKFYGRPGQIKKNLAIYITEEIFNEETIEGFGIR